MEADLVLLEPGLAPRHAAVILRGNTARIEALAEGISIDGVGQVPPGSACTVRLPSTVAIGGIETVWMARVTDAEPTAGPLRSRLRGLFGRTAVSGLASAGLLAVAVVMTVPGPIADAAVPLGGSVKEPVQQLHPFHLEAPSVVSPAAKLDPGPALPVIAPEGRSLPAKAGPYMSIGAVAADLQRQVDEAGLRSVKIEVGGSTITARGSVEPAQWGRWQALQRAFDERVLGEVALVNSVVVRAEKLPAPLNVEGVWRGEQPYVVLHGQRHFIGAVIDGGWAIRAIERDRVMLERDGRFVAVRF